MNSSRRAPVQQDDISEQRRRAINLLVVEPDAQDRQLLRDAIASFGFGSFFCMNDHASALALFQERPFTHVLFSARRTNMPVKEFLMRLLTLDPQVVPMPASTDAAIDDIFDMLRIGARGFLVKPFSAFNLEQSIVMASEAEPFSEAILHARDRNEAFSALQAAALDRLSTVMRQARTAVTARYELPQQMINFRSAVQLSRTFAKGGEAALLEASIEFFINLSDGPASRLGRLRRKLRTERVPLNGEDADDPSPVEKSGPVPG